MDADDGGRYYRGAGGAGGAGGRRNHNRGGGRGRGRGRGFRHQPYNSSRRGGYQGGGGGGAGAGRGNRFGGNQVQQQDPQTAMIRQVYAFVSRVGELKNIPEVTSTTELTPDGLRPVEVTTAGNINDLVAVLCSDDKMELLFKYPQHSQQNPNGNASSGIITNTSNTSAKPEDMIGRLGHLIVGCAASLPLQTACYAALTLAVHEQIKGSPWEEFAPRCVDYAMSSIARDLDAILSGSKDNNVALGACRMKLLLRYLATLGKMGVVQTYQNEQATDLSKLTFFGLLSMMVEAAKAASVGAPQLPDNSTSPAAGHLLAYLVLSTLPYIVDYVPQESIDEWILRPIEALLQSYKSTFTPGMGSTAILLKGEQEEGDADFEDEDDDDDDEEEEANGPICDSLQDLLRVSRRFRESARFALPSDKPWKGLKRSSTLNSEDGETETRSILFSDEPVYLSTHRCRSLMFLFAGEGEFKLTSFNLEGVVFGRLPIFGSPPDPEDDDEGEMDDVVPKNEQLQAFNTRFNILDRFFVSETLRECLICHDPFVNPTGLQQGSAKSVAEELLSACHVFSGENPSKGMEYAIVEVIFGLIAQSWEESTLKHIYLSRVLLELTRLHPQLFSPAIAVAMTNLFGDYLPALVPTSRDNFSRWFAFHLINTDYQWPSAYWQLWEPYAVSPNMSSRGEFVRRALQVMVENLSNPSLLLTVCLESAMSLASEFFPRRRTPAIERQEGDPMWNLETEIGRRVWELSEDPSLLYDFLVGEEATKFLSGVEVNWGKTEALIRALIAPTKKIQEALKEEISSSEKEDDQMVDDTYQSKDFYVAIVEALARYSKTLIGVMAKEAETCGDATQGGAVVLQQVEDLAWFNSSIFQDLVSCLLKNAIVQGLAVFRWALGDLGETNYTDAVSRWWIFGVIALQQSPASTEGTDAMIIDGTAAEASAATARQEMLTFAVKRVCSLVATRNDKRIDPIQVNLIEGMKIIASRSKSMDEKTSHEENSVGGLADLCSGFGGSMAVELLKKCLSQL